MRGSASCWSSRSQKDHCQEGREDIKGSQTCCISRYGSWYRPRGRERGQSSRREAERALGLLLYLLKPGRPSLQLNFATRPRKQKPRRNVQRNEPSTQYQFLSLLSYLLMKLLRANVQEAKNKTARNENISPSSIFMTLRSGRLGLRALRRSHCRGWPTTANSAVKRKLWNREE